MDPDDAKALYRVDWTPHAKRHLLHLFVTVSPEVAAMGFHCGRFPDGDVHNGCDRRIVEGVLIANYFDPHREHFTPPFCVDCEANQMKGDAESEWNWTSFDQDAWEAMLAGYMDDIDPAPVPNTAYDGHRLCAGVELACYFDGLNSLLDRALPSPNGPLNRAEWYEEHPDWRAARIAAVNFLMEIVQSPSIAEKDWARFWWYVARDAKVNLDKYPLLNQLLVSTGERRNRFELLFDE